MYSHATRNISYRLRSGRRIDGLCSTASPKVGSLHFYCRIGLTIQVILSFRGDAAAEISTDAMTTVQQHQEPDKGDSPLGVVPHSIRGFLHRHQQVLPATEAFYNCTACSPLVLQRYAESGYAFLLEVFNNPDCLEQVSGLADLHKDMTTAEV